MLCPKIFPRLCLLLVCACGILFLYAEGRWPYLNALQTAGAAHSVQGESTQPSESTPSAAGKADKKNPNYVEIEESWHGLLDRLQDDGLHDENLMLWFKNPNQTYSSMPMGRKITSLFKKRFTPAPPAKPGQKATGPALYLGVVVTSNIDRCVDFLELHKKIFDAAEKKYGVPPNILAALLMIETKLGDYLGAPSPFWNLSCMAAATTPEHIQSHLDALPLTKEHDSWLQQTMQARSDWAYKELVALIAHVRENNLNPLEMPGSIFGALGICQFMPSNIPLYAVDGDGDGRIDLFSFADAAHSAANFLKAHGWKKGLSTAASIQVLKKYNNSLSYANTVIALAQGVDKAQKDKKKPAPAKAGQNSAKSAPAANSAQPTVPKAKTSAQTAPKPAR